MDPRLSFAPLLLLALAISPHPQASVRPASASGRPVTTLSAPCELVLAPYAGPLRTVTVKSDSGGSSGSFSAPFLFDTGGGGTVLTPATAKALGLEPFGRSTGFRHDGGRVDGARAGPVELALGTFTRRGEVGVLDLGSLLAGLPDVGGIVSLETFAGNALTVDLAANRVFVESPATLAARIAGATELAVRSERQASGASFDLYAAVEGEHGWQWFELDCGNAGPVLLAPHAFVELGLDPPPPGRETTLELPLVGLGDFSCTVQCKEMIHDGLLNAAFFTRYRVSLDLAAERAWVRASS